jgi:hypothetical protein
MSYNRFMPVEVTAQSRILVSHVVIKEESSKLSSRFGVTYECVFNEKEITIGIANPLNFKFKQMDEAKAVIPYEKVEAIKFSIVRLPIVSTHQHGHNFALDVLIQNKDNSFHLETAAFKLIPNIVELARLKNIQVIDPIGVIDLSSGLSLQAVKEKFKPIYDQLKEKYNLQDVRTLDDRSRVNI